MKPLKFITMIALAGFAGATIMTGCKDDPAKVKGCMDKNSTNYNPAAEEDDGSCAGPGTSTTDLLSKSVTTAPTVDGVIDAAWANCKKLTGTATVPGVADFTNFTGESYSFTLRAMHDATNIYFLAEWADPKDSKDREAWYFDTATKLWKQQNKMATSATDKWYEDKAAFLWPVTVGTDWNNTTCYSTCHSGMDQTKGYNTTTKHYTSTGNVVDMWHWKRVRTGTSFCNQIDDQKMIAIVDVNNPTATEKKEGGRGADDKTSGGYSDNKQTLGVTNDTAKKVSVPKYVIPAQAGYYWITKAEIDNGTAKLITAVDANGVLTYSGGTIDPAQGGYEMNTGTKRMPSVTVSPFVGSRGDITAYSSHTGKGWILEFKRALKTTDTTNDVQYDITKEYKFGFAIFENAAIAHGIKPDLTLKFK